jgi:predicted protein tyrosine phosphatase
MRDDLEENDVDVEEEDAVSGAWDPDFHWFTDHLAVGGSFPIECATELVEAHGIRAVVDLRAENCDDERVLRAAGVDFLHLPTADMDSANPDHLEIGVSFVAERLRRGEKVLIHCEHGVGRSALLALCVLVDQGFDPLAALTHAKERREAVSPSYAQYAGWARWLAARGIEPPDYHSFGCIAYRHLAGR